MRYILVRFNHICFRSAFRFAKPALALASSSALIYGPKMRSGGTCRSWRLDWEPWEVVVAWSFLGIAGDPKRSKGSWRKSTRTSGMLGRDGIAINSEDLIFCMIYLGEAD